MRIADMNTDTEIANMAFEPLVKAARGNARALLALAAKALLRADPQRAYELVQEAKATAPDSHEIHLIGDDLLARSLPNWHVRMVKDSPRNEAFEAALKRAVTPDRKVLDIGSGSGLLAMMAARAGARDVHSCEFNPAVAATARDIVAANGYADRVRVHAKSSRLLDVESDLGGKPDVIVAEIIGNDLVCEDVLPTMLDAARRLAKPDTCFIPQAGEIRVALAWLDDLSRRYLSDECGFDLTLFNRLNPVRHDVQVDDPALTIRGEVASLYQFDFSVREPADERAGMELIASGGRVNGVIQWFRLQMDEAATFENRPGPEATSSWACEFFPFRQEIKCEEGDRIAIAATVVGNRLRLWQV
jgi:type III protein arginine methyltransferase